MGLQPGGRAESGHGGPGSPGRCCGGGSALAVQLPSGGGGHHLTLCRTPRLLEKHPEERDTALATLAYFDQLNLAEGIVCPALIASAIIDEVHPLRTVMPVFEKIPAMKSIIVYPDLEHEYRSDFTSHGKAWMDRYLR
jgi:hypothetical protein